jgi:hypothetical protein
MAKFFSEALCGEVQGVSVSHVGWECDCSASRLLDCVYDLIEGVGISGDEANDRTVAG